ncbi:MAG: hypothetical protein JWO71_3876 [Candidatus Acidoferrum typicum]|nr:hypothetical protein [Candidatus Acidoferrum typicum]
MTLKSLSSDFTPERCQYRTATGRQCLSPVVDPGSPFCPRHAFAQPSESDDFLAPLTQRACRFQNAAGVNYSLGALYTLLAQGRISPRRATALAYISSLLLRTLPAIDSDLYPHAGKPGFSPNGEPTTQDEIDTATDTTDNTSQSEDTTKSQTPN